METYKLKPKIIYSNTGIPFTVWGKKMPRINDQYLDTVIYLYPTKEDAEAGRAFGGTGFLIGYPFQDNPDLLHIYAVTNSHVIREGNSKVIRFNTINNDTTVLETNDDNWIHHPDGDDLAVCYLGGFNEHLLKYKVVATKDFLTKELVESFTIGIGDEVFMVGRFSMHDGKQTNLPSARFGNISMMPYEQIRHERQYDVDAFLIETRSLSGYSGSPVFVYIDLGAERGWSFRVDDIKIWLLGVDFGHLPIYEKVKEKDGKTNVYEGYVVPSNSGQMAVVPTWILAELLETVDFTIARKQTEQTESEKETITVISDVLKPPLTEDLKKMQ